MLAEKGQVIEKLLCPGNINRLYELPTILVVELRHPVAESIYHEVRVSPTLRVGIPFFPPVRIAKESIQAYISFARIMRDIPSHVHSGWDKDQKVHTSLTQLLDDFKRKVIGIEGVDDAKGENIESGSVLRNSF
jgi:hypothetical protein